MGARTGKEPSVEDSFLWRICHALDETPRVLARNIGVPYKDLEPLLKGPRVDIDRDEVWWLIDEHVARKLGALLAIRQEMNRALQDDRVRRAARMERFKRLAEDD